jgi:outer membrane receptor protein involved in Fe transport
VASPLAVTLLINGVVVPAASIDSIQPGDIEEIEIIKSAPAASLYGSTTGNSRIIITTRASRARNQRLIEKNQAATTGPRGPRPP